MLSVFQYGLLEDDAGALVRRPALKTGFSEMGWGSTPPSSTKIEGCPSG
jgi:hypothetical protein